MNDTRAKLTIKRFLLTLLICALVAVAAFFAIVRPLQMRHEKAQFEKAAVQLQSLADQIQVKVGKAVDLSPSKHCSHPHLKYEEGPTNCFVGVSMSYSIADATEATNKSLSASQLFSSQLRPGPLMDMPLSFRDHPTTPATQYYFQDIDNTDGLACTISYSYDENASGQLKFILSCDRPTINAYYAEK